MNEAWCTKLVEHVDSTFSFRSAVAGDSHVQCFALPHNQVKCTHCFFERGGRVGAMVIEDIYIFESHSLETLIQTGHEVFLGAEVAIWAVPHPPASLRGYNQFVAMRLEIFFENNTKCFLG